jgi:hypothetical protein
MLNCNSNVAAYSNQKLHWNLSPIISTSIVVRWHYRQAHVALAMGKMSSFAGDLGLMSSSLIDTMEIDNYQSPDELTTSLRLQ